MPRPNPQSAIPNLLTTRQNKAGSAVISQYNYSVNLLGQRSAVSQTGTAISSARSIAWGYDPLGQVLSADSSINTADRTYQYGAQSRRIDKTTGTNKSVFLYNGWNSIADYSLSSNLLSLSHTRLWGSDLSGSMQGAGGVGGLLSESNISNPQSPISYPLYDGNGKMDKEVVAWSNVNFLHLCGPGGYRVNLPDGTSQDIGLLMGISPIRVDSLRQLARRIQREYRETEIPVLPSLAEAGPSFKVLEGEAGSPAMDTLEQLHALFKTSGDALKEQYLAREKARAERKAFLLANPPKPEDVTVRVWKRTPSKLQNDQQEESR